MESSPRILIADELDPAALEVFRRRGLEPVVRTGLKGEKLLEAVAEIDALVVRSATKVTAEVLAAAPHLKVVGRAGIGIDNIDLAEATKRGVIVMNTPLGNATTTAELAIALLFSMARHVPQANQRAHAGNWKKKGLMGTEVTGKTLGVIGFGRIGRLVAERGQGVGLKVVAFDPYLDRSKESPVPGAELVDLPELMGRADFITLHVPLTDSTRDMISWEQLKLVKPGARLINAARGGVVNEEAVLDALSDGRLAGAAFDVFTEEPPPADHPLLLRDDVIVTPHLGASSTEAQLRVALDVAEQISTFLLEGVAQNAINAPTVSSDAMAELAPFLLLAQKMGSMITQRMGGLPRKLELTVRGDVGRHGLEHFRLALLTGVLEKALGVGGVNSVNAPTLAEERGVLVLETREADAKYTHGEIAISAVEEAGGPNTDLVGTVFAHEPRIVHVDGVDLDLPLRGVVLVLRHNDRPGVLGEICGTLGNEGINIQRLELAPLDDGSGRSMGLLTLDLSPSEAVLELLRATDAVASLSVVNS